MGILKNLTTESLLRELARRGEKEQASSFIAQAADTLLPASTTPDMHVFASGAKRSELKPRYDLIPKSPLKRLAHRYELGARSYGDWNWQKGLPAGDTLNHIIEHLLEWQRKRREGELSNDDDLAAAAWGCFALMWLEEKGKFTDADKKELRTEWVERDVRDRDDLSHQSFHSD